MSATPPLVIGGAIVVPAGLLSTAREVPTDTTITESIAMQAVMEAEVSLGNDPRDVSAEKLGYDIEGLDPRAGRLRFIEVKGRQAGADTVTVTCNEILYSLNVPEQFILALVEVEDGHARPPCYVREPFGKEPDFGVTSVNYDLQELLARSEPPS